MPTFMCFLNWTDQAAKALKDAPKRYEATKSLVTKLGGRLVCAYVTTGQYDVALVVEMPMWDNQSIPFDAALAGWMLLHRLGGA